MEAADFSLPSGGDLGFPTAQVARSTIGRKRRRDEDDSGAALPWPVSKGVPATSSASSGAAGKKKSGGFQGMGLSPEVLNGILRMGFKQPTPIQRRVLPVALSGKDVVAMARTGSGKTAAFLIPMLERLKQHSTRIGARAIVLSPTRELALQTHKVAKGLAKFLDLRMCALVGGESMGEQFSALAENPDVLIGTPGRLMHLLLEVPGFNLRQVEFAVFDEADRLFEMGFADQLKAILGKLPEQRQALLLSATLPSVLVQFAKAGLREPELIRLDTETRVSEALRLAFFTVRGEEKPGALLWILKTLIPEDQQAIVFASTRHHVEVLTVLLQKAGLKADAVYGAMDQTARKTNLARFRARTSRVLVVTDVAARGLDVPLLDNVINFDAPDKAKLFVHRVGRVARQGRRGVAITLLSAGDVPYFLDLMLFLGRPVSNEAAPPSGGGMPSSSSSSSAAAATGGGGYTFATMRAEDVHYGSLPRVALEAELETHRRIMDGAPELQQLARSAVNANKLYNKTRAEASRTSVLRARELPDDRVHPMLSEYGGAGESELRSYVAGLAAFRPPQTIMEVDGARTGKAGTEAIAKIAANRAAQAHLVGARVGSVAMRPASAAAARGTADMRGFGAAVRQQLEGQQRGRSGARRRSNGEAEAGDVSASSTKYQRLDDDGSDDADKDYDDDAERAGRARRRGRGADDGDSADGSSDDDDGAANDDEFVADDDDDHQFSDDGGSDGDGGGGGAGRSRSSSRDAAAAAAAAAASLGKQRMSAAERKKLRRASSALSSSTSSSSSSQASAVASSSAAALLSSAQSAAAASGGGVTVTSLAMGSSGGNHARLTSLPKAERRAMLREAAAAVSAGGASGVSAVAMFRDAEHYVTHAPELDRALEAAYGSAGAGPAERSGKGDTLAADLEGVTRLEDATLDLVGDEKSDMTAARRVRYWDARKKRYLLVNASEVAHGTRRKPSVRNEAGALVDRSGAPASGSGAVGAAAYEYGDIYRRWQKATRKAVEGGGEEEGAEGGSGGDYEEGDGGRSSSSSSAGRNSGGGSSGRGRGGGGRGGGGGRSNSIPGTVEFGSSRGGRGDDTDGDDGAGGGGRGRGRSGDASSRGGSRGRGGSSSQRGGRGGKPISQELRGAGEISKDRFRRAKGQGTLPSFRGKGGRGGGSGGRGRGGGGRGGSGRGGGSRGGRGGGRGRGR